MDDERYTRITLRLPKELHGHLSEAADKTSKSLNAEIIERLTRTFSEAPAVNGVGMREIFDRLAALEAAVKSGEFVPFSETPEGKAWAAKRAKK